MVYLLSQTEIWEIRRNIQSVLLVCTNDNATFSVRNKSEYMLAIFVNPPVICSWNVVSLIRSFFFIFIRKMNDIFISLIWASLQATYRDFLNMSMFVRMKHCTVILDVSCCEVWRWRTFDRTTERRLGIWFNLWPWIKTSDS